MNTNTVMPLEPTSPPRSSPPKNVRRKASFFRQEDSSEESPLSSSSSIFEAFLFSGSNSEESAYKTETWPRIKQPIFQGIRPNKENERQPTSSSRSETTPIIPETEFLYGHGTVLDTITEQKSYGTIRSVARTKSAEELLTVPLLGHRDSFTLGKSASCRKHSFSLDDIWTIKDSYHEACAMIERVARRSLSIHEIYAKPKEPIIAPPERPSTPPGCPSWTEAQQPGPRPHLVPNHTRLQRFLRIPSSGLKLSTRPPSTSFSFTRRSVSAPAETPRLPPRFRVPKSVYSAIENHPFSRAVVHKTDSEHPVDPPRLMPAPESSNRAQKSRIPGSTSVVAPAANGRGKGKAKLVRFTPSATARDSEMLNLRNAMEATSYTAFHPLDGVIVPESQQPPRSCPHRKAQHPKLKTLNAEFTIPPSNEYLPLASIASVASFSHYELNARGPSPGISVQMSPIERMPTITSKAPSIAVSLLSDHNTEMAPEDDSLDMCIIDSFPHPPSTHPSNPYLMSGALLTPSTPQSAIEVPIMTGAQLMTIRPHTENTKLVSNEGKICWKCKYDGVKSKFGSWMGRSGDWLCFVCCGGDFGEWDLQGESEGEARRRRRAVLAGVPGVGL
ncbi:hypothetical protein CJF32_00000395 [Rutstroemia sp. NJR-2017a WRK4]|nr:hypothetical protein CJF32_00000395 [Rutstroemia sp. NJR-2017a WRK4]